MQQDLGTQSIKYRLRSSKYRLSHGSIAFLSSIADGVDVMFGGPYIVPENGSIGVTNAVLANDDPNAALDRYSKSGIQVDSPMLARAEAIIRRELMEDSLYRGICVSKSKWREFVQDRTKSDELLLVLYWMYRTSHCLHYALKCYKARKASVSCCSELTSLLATVERELCGIRKLSTGQEIKIPVPSLS